MSIRGGLTHKSQTLSCCSHSNHAECAGFGANGQGRDRSLAARRLFKRGRNLASSCAEGRCGCRVQLGQAYRLGRGVPINLAIAKSWFEKAANNGHLDAETTLGLLLFQNGDQAAGMKWLKRAAEQGEPRALLVYGTALYNGDGVSQDKLLGYAYVSRAAEDGLAPAKDTLAQLDELLPAVDRQKAAALSHSIPREPSQPQAKTVKPVEFAKAKSVPVPPAAKPAKGKTAEPPAAKPAPQLRATGNWRIQLGAFPALFGRSAL